MATGVGERDSENSKELAVGVVEPLLMNMSSRVSKGVIEMRLNA